MEQIFFESVSKIHPVVTYQERLTLRIYDGLSCSVKLFIIQERLLEASVNRPM